MYRTIIEDKIPTGEMISSEINLGNNVRLVPENQYKYTLTNDIVEARVNGMLVGGTPLVNEVSNDNTETNRFPESGGIVGPLYLY